MCTQIYRHELEARNNGKRVKACNYRYFTIVWTAAGHEGDLEQFEVEVLWSGQGLEELVELPKAHPYVGPGNCQMAVGSWADRRETIEGWVNTRTAMTLLFVFWATHVVSPKTTKIDFSNGEILSKFFYVLGGTIDSFCISLWPIWPTPSKVSIPNNVSVLAHLPEEYSRVCGSEDLLVYDTSLPQPFVTSEEKKVKITQKER